MAIGNAMPVVTSARRRSDWVNEGFVTVKAIFRFLLCKCHVSFPIISSFWGGKPQGKQ
jgi:hypothetical protein